MATTAEIRLVLEAQDKASGVLASVQRAITNIGNAPTAALAKVQGAANTATKAAGGFGAALASVGATAVGVAIGGGLAALPGALFAFAQGAADDEAATARLSQTIRNLGGDYDEIVGKVDKAISAGQRLAYSDDDVRDSFNFLATATGDATEAISRQRLAMDVARGANIPLAQATKMLGRLNAENIETFRKLGIVIGDNATEAEALAAIQAKFAGQAEAYANSTAGQFEQAKIAMGEIGESIGAAVLPVLAAVGRVLSENLPAIQDFVGSLSKGISQGVVPVLEALVPLFQRTFGALLPVIQPLLDVLPDLGRAIAQVVDFMANGSGDIEVFRGVLNRLIGPEGAQAVIEVFTNLVGFFRETVMPLWGKLADAAKLALGGDLAGALKTALEAIGAFAVKLVESLAAWAKRFVEWVAPLIPPLLVELGKVLIELNKWVISTALPEIGKKLLEWAVAFVQWVAPLIPPMLLELGKVLLKLGDWTVETALPEIVKALATWGKAFIDWVVIDVLPKLPGEIAKISAAILQWLADAHKPIVTAAVDLAVALAAGFMAELNKLPGAAWSAVAGDQSGSLKSSLVAGLRAVVDAAAAAIRDVYVRLTKPFEEAWSRIKALLDKIRGAREEANSSGGGSAEYRQQGGPVAAGRAYIVGEAGPELFVPGRSGLIIPNGQTASGAGGSAIGASSMTVYVTVQGSVTTEAELTTAIYNGLLERSRRNGGLSFEPVAF